MYMYGPGFFFKFDFKHFPFQSFFPPQVAEGSTAGTPVRCGPAPGTVVNTAARMEAIAHGGQVIVSQNLINALFPPLWPSLDIATSLGTFPMRGVAGRPRPASRNRSQSPTTHLSLPKPETFPKLGLEVARWVSGWARVGDWACPSAEGL